MAVRLFDALKMESQTIRFTVQEATNSLTAAYKVLLTPYCCCLLIATLLEKLSLMVLSFISNDE